MHTAQLLIELGAVVFGLGLVGRLAGRVGLSPIPLYLLAGLAFGEGGLVPLEAPEDFVSTGAQIGVILLLLMLGLEYSASDLVSQVRRQLPVGLFDLVVNGLPGVLMAWLLGWGGTGMLAMFGITAVTSSGITAKILTDLGRLGNRETPSVLGVLVLEDLAMAVYLPVLTAVLAASSGVNAARSVAISLAVLAAVLLVAVRHGRLVSAAVSAGSHEILLLLVLGLALLVAGAAEAVHVSAAVGAFLLGIALSGDVAELVRPLLEPVRDLFAALFFVFFGLSTDPGDLPAVLLPAIALALVTVGTKLVTGWVAARRSGIGVPGRLRAGAALVPHGEFSIVIAGLAASSTHPRLAPLTAAYAMILAIAGPILARVVEPVGRKALRRSAPAA